MAYREVTMLEVKEVLRLWLDGVQTSPKLVALSKCHCRPASATGSDQAQSPSNDTAAAPTTQPAKKPTRSLTVFFSRSWVPFYQRLPVPQRVQQRKDGVGQVARHHGRRRCAGHGEAQERELTRHRGDRDHRGNASHPSARTGRRIPHHAEIRMQQSSRK